MTISLNWDLASLFTGGSQSATLADFLDQIITDLNNFRPNLDPLTVQNQAEWAAQIQHLYDITTRLDHASAFVGCLVSQDVNDDKAFQLEAQSDQLWAQLGTHWTKLTALFAQQDETAWADLINNTELKHVAFNLNELRELARQKMSPELEALATELAADGYHGWNRLYNTVSGDKQVMLLGEELSLGQLQNRYEDDPDREVRRKAFELYEASWLKLAKTCAASLNNQAGFRLTLYKNRGWDSILKEPLMNNRLSRETLEAMWSTIDSKNGKLLDYLSAKAKRLGLEQLHWYDVFAPVGEVAKTFTYQEAGEFVIEAMKRFNPDIAQFCRMAIDKEWIESENRSGKRAGGFCTSFPVNGETRIFMTYNGSYNGMLTLAHELGHSYHDWVMRDLPYGASQYAMNVAETASTFNELVVNDASLRATDDPQERLSLLGAKLSNAMAMLMNIKSRFDFEMAFFERRAKQQLSVDELNELMVTAQRNAFKDSLVNYHPYFWASKLHFYITEAPFYNFPYTFGYLFSNGVYAQALSEGPAFVDRYIAMLRDTGSMDTEILAHTHLGVDLTKPEFWETALDRILGDVDTFVDLVDKMA
ncbi:M3 family oligoendopeptidase [Anaerolineales bacterium HSG24]|nr:M3 family oligoendopeptidase [Anaerolineales bacterium HSG24]